MKAKLLFPIALAALCGCGGGTAPGSAPGVTLEGRAGYADGSPASGALVRLRPWDYLSPAVPKVAAARADTFADSGGNFRVTGLDTGRYVLELGAGEESGAALPLHLDGSRAAVTVEGVLRSTASLRGNLRDTSGNPAAGTQVAIHGLEFRAACDSAGDFRFDALPPDSLTLRVIPATGPGFDVGVKLTPMEDRVLDTLRLP